MELKNLIYILAIIIHYFNGIMKKLFFLFILLPFLVRAQELSAKVTVNYEQLPNSAKENLADFQNAVEDYLNNSRFTDLDYQEKILCNFSFFFVSAQSDVQYSAQVVITSQRPIYNSQKNSLMLRIQDSKWDFEYEKNQTLYFNQTDFNSLTSFLDYYAYMIIAFDLDSYDNLGGSEYFNRALEITVLGGNSSYSKGWQLENSSYNRRKLVEEVTSATFQRFREDYFNYHYNGLDLMSENPKLARKNIALLVEHLDEIKDKIDPRSVLMKVFFDAKHRELADNLFEYDDPSIYDKLVRIDPAHLTYYRQKFEGE